MTISTVTSSTTRLPSRVEDQRKKGENTTDEVWKKYSGLAGHGIKVTGVGGKVAGNKTIGSWTKSGSETLTAITTVDEVLSGKMTFEKIDKALENVLFSETFSDDDVKALSWLYTCEEIIQGLVDPSKIAHWKEALGSEKFAALKNTIEKWCNTSSLAKRLTPISSSLGLPTAPLEALSLPFRCLSALKLQGKIESTYQAITTLDDPKSTTSEKAEAGFSLLGTAAVVGSFGLTFFSGVPTWALTTMSAAGAISGAASWYFKYSTTPEQKIQKEVRELIEKDFNVLRKESNEEVLKYQRKPEIRKQHSEQFSKFAENVDSILDRVRSAKTKEELAGALDDYSKERAKVELIQTDDVVNSGKKVASQLEKLKSEELLIG
jgi:hypothetical protein